MKKLILLLALCLFIAAGYVDPIETYAYTEEEKQMAKDWLSAHGYAPTRAGAEQAYQDYLDGKFGDIYQDQKLEGEVNVEKESKKKDKKKKDKTEQTTNEASTESSETTTETKAQEVTTTEAEPTETAIEEESTKDSKTEDSKSEKEAKEEQKKRNWTAVGILGAAAVVVVLGGFFVFFRKKD